MSAEPVFEPDRVVDAILSTLGGQHPIEGPLTGASLARPASFKVQTEHGEVQVLNRMDLAELTELRGHG